MAEPSYSRRARGGVTLPYPPPRIESEVMDGNWFKTNDKPQWIESLAIDTVDGETFVRIRGGLAPSPSDWGRVRCESVYANAPDTNSARAGGFITHYDFDDMTVEVQANYNMGLLVVATYVTFKSPDAFADRFTREFFFRG
ncbi:MAG TPA: hypothetical protein VEK57_24830 [Thermoanaerobaculia bacterium]|nr:hypothetical protein [Thermoanaerobaculia bacterium]